ncbi:hypothetical protein EVAR_39457_1 [Eumeta japonica]|uniref:Mariner Mos1 transposase n=1 Tax=Eumeta variegata TaxID=151549 RepID=A0A4C1W1T8_EUMVA|nr:hypothetical protein EVAR_39457_1 [Eumeta japonica]
MCSMLRVWLDWKDIIHYKLVPPSETITSYLYCQQLMRPNQEVAKKWPKLTNKEDDTSLYALDARPRALTYLQRALDSLGDWFSKWKIENLVKNAVVYVSRSRSDR